MNDKGVGTLIGVVMIAIVVAICAVVSQHLGQLKQAGAQVEVRVAGQPPAMGTTVTLECQCTPSVWLVRLADGREVHARETEVIFMPTAQAP